MKGMGDGSAPVVHLGKWYRLWLRERAAGQRAKSLKIFAAGNYVQGEAVGCQQRRHLLAVRKEHYLPVAIRREGHHIVYRFSHTSPTIYMKVWKFTQKTEGI